MRRLLTCAPILLSLQMLRAPRNRGVAISMNALSFCGSKRPRANANRLLVAPTTRQRTLRSGWRGFLRFFGIRCNRAQVVHVCVNMCESQETAMEGGLGGANDQLGAGPQSSPAIRHDSSVGEPFGQWDGVHAQLRTYRTEHPLVWSDTRFEVMVLIRGSVITSHLTDAIEEHAIHGTAWPSFPGNPQQLRVRPQPGAQLLQIVLSASLMRSAQDQSGPVVWGVRGFGGCHDLLIEQIAREFIREMTHKSYCGTLLVRSLADSLALRLLQLQASATIAVPYPARRNVPRAEQRMRRVFELIENRRDKCLAIAELAAVARMSPFHFSRMFKKLTGVAPIHYINDRRIALAKELLTKSERTLLDITHYCQFLTYSGFSRAFRRSTGVSPADYRRFGSSSTCSFTRPRCLSQRAQPDPGPRESPAFSRTRR